MSGVYYNRDHIKVNQKHLDIRKQFSFKEWICYIINSFFVGSHVAYQLF